MYQNNKKSLPPTLVLAAACAWIHTALAAPLSTSVDDEAQYRQGLYQRETGQPYTAIETLETLLTGNPTLNRARLELAVAYYRTLNFTEARAQAQKVLDDPQTPDAVRLSVLSFLKKLELEEAQTFGKPHKLDTNLSVGLLHDSNVNAGPDNAVLPGGFVLNPGATAQADWGYTAQGSLTHTWQYGAPVRLGEATGRLGWTSQAALFYRGYNRETDYNLGVLTLATGPTLIVGTSTRANLNGQLDALTLGGHDLALYSSLSPSISWRLGQSAELALDTQWVYRDFHRSEDAGRSSRYRALGLGFGDLYNQNRLAVQLGIRLFDENAHDSRYTNDGLEAFLSLRQRVWAGIDLFARGAWRHSTYDGVEPLYGQARKEIERRIELGASHQFQDGWLDKWALSGTVTHIHNDANLSIYRYNRDLVQVTLGRSY